MSHDDKTDLEQLGLFFFFWWLSVAEMSMPMHILSNCVFFFVPRGKLTSAHSTCCSLGYVYSFYGVLVASEPGLEFETLFLF